jgi:outer membrane lipopolysaccharide assembly protein LptE/RlpB
MVSAKPNDSHIMQKIEGWEKLFTAFLINSKNIPFHWGKWDCVNFVDSCYFQLTKKHVIPKELNWKCKRSAIVQIAKYGGDLQGAVRRALFSNDFHLITKNYKKSDIILFKEDSFICGIYNGSSVCAVSDQGITVKENDLIVEGFRCG